MEFSQQVSRDYTAHHHHHQQQQQQQHQVWSSNHTSGPPMMHEIYPPHGFMAAGPHPHFTSPPATPMTPMTPATLQPPFSNIHHQFQEVPPTPLYHQTHQLPHPHPPPPCPPTPEFRLFCLCQHLQKYPSITKENRGAFWKDFMSEYFVEEAALVIEVEIGGKMEKFRLKGEWVCRYFESLMDNGVTSVHFDLIDVDSNYQMNLQQLECRMATMETHHVTPHVTKVCVSGHLNMEFSLDPNPRIMVWYFNIKDHMEYIPRSSSTFTPNPQQNEQMGVATEGITTKGLLASTLAVLREGEGAEESSYHRTPDSGNFPTPATPMEGSAPNSGLHHPGHWQDNIHLLPMAPGMELMHQEASGAGLSTGGLIQTVSPVGPLQHILPSPSSSSPCIPHPHGINAGGSGSKGAGSVKAKASRSNSSGSRKRHSPTSEISNSVKRGCLLVAEEPVQIPDPDDLVFAMDERIIERIDKNSQGHFNGKTEPQTPPTSRGSATPTPSGSSPGNCITVGGNMQTPTAENILNGVNLTTPPTPTPSVVGNGGTNKLFHLQDHFQHMVSTSTTAGHAPSSSSPASTSSMSIANNQGLSHSTTVNSSMQGVELEQANHHMMGGAAILNQHAPHMYDSPMTQWSDKLLLVNQGPMTITR